LAALSPEGDPETTGSGRRFGGAQVYQLRLPLMANEQLRELAAHHQTSPMALAQEWVLQRLEWESQHLNRR
jgi:aryl-alcohol dehydrogenase-like predicted oxidoreductase